jgi:hypothetical protein
MSGDPIVTDALGNPLTVGARVRVPRVGGPTRGYDLGTVTKITDPDGDVNEYGRPVPILPKVFVTFDEGDEDHFAADWRWQEDAFECDDVERIED